MKLYTTTHYELARQVRAYFNIVNSELVLTKFSDGEILVSLPEAFAQQTVVLIQALSAPVNDAIMQTVFALEALKLARAINVILIVTYLGYSRQDRLTRARSLISCSVVCRLLCLNAAINVYLLEPHAPQIMGFLSVPNFALGLTAIVCEHIGRTCELSSLVVIALDCGSAHRASKISKALGVSMVSAYKLRGANQVKVSFQRDLRLAGKTAIIIDDIVDTGKSVNSAVRALLTIHSVRRVQAYCVHGVLSSESALRTVVHVSNSIPCTQHSISVEYFISRLLKRVLADKPYDELLL
ncbi:MAG: ribose-phosphate diphosphokinase [Candidatus Hodgkinia cicadicola]